MHTVSITIDGTEYVAVPKDEYVRLAGKVDEDGTVDALSYTLRRAWEEPARGARVRRPNPGGAREEAAQGADHSKPAGSRQAARVRGVGGARSRDLRTAAGLIRAGGGEVRVLGKRRGRTL